MAYTMSKYEKETVRRDGMQSIEQNGGMCKSVFTNSSPAEIKKSYNRRWIELINRMEKQRQPAITRQT